MLLLAAVFFVFAMTIEGTFVALPIVLSLLIVLHVAYPTGWTICLAFLAGLFLDTMLFRQLGQTSFFFVVFLTLISLYERKFEVRTYQFLLFAILIGVSLYLLFFGSAAFFLQLGFCLLSAALLFPLFVRKRARSETFT